MEYTIDSKHNLILTADGIARAVLPVYAIAARYFLLNCVDYVEAIAACLMEQEPDSSIAPDSRNIWTSAFEQAERDWHLDRNQTSKVELIRPANIDGQLVVRGDNTARIALGLPTLPVAAIRDLDDTGEVSERTISLPDWVERQAVEQAARELTPYIDEAVTMFRQQFEPLQLAQDKK